MPDVFASPPLLSLPLPLVPAWAQGLNQSIRAPGTGAQQSLCAAQRSAALSGSMHLQPVGELGERGQTLVPLHAGYTGGLLPSAQHDPSILGEKHKLIPRYSRFAYNLRISHPCLTNEQVNDSLKLLDISSNRLLGSAIVSLKNKNKKGKLAHAHTNSIVCSFP